MTSTENLLELHSSREVFRTLFTIANGISDPVLPMNQIMHWQAVRSTLDISTPKLDAGRTLVFGGYFYNFSTPTLSEADIKKAMDLAVQLETGQYLVPTVRDDVETRALVNAAFVQIPWFVESVFEIESSVECDVKRRVGSKRFREIFGHWIHAREKYRWDWHSAKDLRDNSQLVELIADLHLQNVQKYHHTVNLYPASVLRELTNSTLGEHLVVGVRRELKTERAVQTVICMQDKVRRELFVMVHGRDYDHEPAWLNFYSSQLFEIYKYAEQAGLHTLYLGRGNHDLKRRLGANRFRVLSNWVRSETQEARLELDLLRESAKQVLRLDQLNRPQESPSIHAQARKSLCKVRWPFSLVERQKLEKAGHIDLASSIGVRQFRDVQYPDLEQLNLKVSYIGFLREEAIRKHPESDLSLATNQLIFTRGITEAIDLLIRAFCEPGQDRVLIPEPTFPMYEYWAKVTGVAVTRARLGGENLDSLDLEQIASDRHKLTFLCTPNNPVGSCLDLEQIAALATRSTGLVVVDEAYGEFSTNPSVIRLISKYPNIVVLRTFSKAWGLASLRCGVVIADPKIISTLQLVQGPFAIPIIIQTAVIQQLSNVSSLFQDVKATCEERDRVVQALRRTNGVEHIYASDANFLCVKFCDMRKTVQKLQRAQIIVENTGAELPDSLRISIGSRTNNEKLLRALQTELEILDA